MSKTEVERLKEEADRWKTNTYTLFFAVLFIAAFLYWLPDAQPTGCITDERTGREYCIDRSTEVHIPSRGY